MIKIPKKKETMEENNAGISYEKQKRLIELKHKSKMEELEYMRETNKLTHSMELERGRIKAAEIRKNIERKQRFFRSDK